MARKRAVAAHEAAILLHQYAIAAAIERARQAELVPSTAPALPQPDGAGAPSAADASSPAKKKKKVKKTARFAQGTKRGVPSYAAPTKAAGVRRGRNQRGQRNWTPDLDVVGMTHRAYTDAKDAVRNRKKPEKPQAPINQFDQEKWEWEQIALTNELNETYKVEPKKPKDTKEPFVPKQRKTQRAVQKPRRGGRSGAFAHGTADV